MRYKSLCCDRVARAGGNACAINVGLVSVDVHIVWRANVMTGVAHQRAPPIACEMSDRTSRDHGGEQVMTVTKLPLRVRLDNV